jgi:hypothetical protein
MKIQVDVPIGDVEKALLEELKLARRKIIKLEGTIESLRHSDTAAKEIIKANKILKEFVREHFSLWARRDREPLKNIDLDALERTLYPVDGYTSCGWEEEEHLALLAELREKRDQLKGQKVEPKYPYSPSGRGDNPGHKTE